MEAGTRENPAASPDSGIVAKIVYEFNVARRHVSTYPKGHPAIADSCARVARLFGRLFAEQDHLTIGVAKDSLVIAENAAVPHTPITRHFAASLFYHRLALVTFRKGLTAREIESFNGILAMRREQVAAQAGFASALHDAGVTNLGVKEISYDAFQASNDDPPEDPEDGKPADTLWESFTRELLQGTLQYADGVHPRSVPLSSALLDHLRQQEPHDQIRMVQHLARMLGQEAQRGSLPERILGPSGQVIDFIAGLPPELLGQFLIRFLQDLEGMEDVSRDLLSRLPHPAVQEASRLLRGHGGSLPLPGDSASLSGRAESVPGPDRETVPRLSNADTEALSRLLPALSDRSVDLAFGALILESLRDDTKGRQALLQRRLLDLVRSCLEAGDFRTLADIHDRFVSLPPSGEQAGDAQAAGPADIFGGGEFVAGVLAGLERWGRDRHEDIGRLIGKVGRPFIEPLLDRLSIEENRTVRRFCLVQLQGMAGLAREAALARLDDRRWYVVRNLLTILRHDEDPELPRSLRRLAAHPHPKVRQLLVDICLQFRDPEGDRLLLADMSGNNAALRLQAIQLAGKSLHPQVFENLLNIVRRNSLSAAAQAEKRAAIRALSETGNIRALPVLGEILTQRVLFRSSFHRSLKREIVLTLGNYRDPAATALLAKVAGSRDTELAALAAGQLQGHGSGGDT